MRETYVPKRTIEVEDDALVGVAFKAPTATGSAGTGSTTTGYVPSRSIAADPPPKAMFTLRQSKPRRATSVWHNPLVVRVATIASGATAFVALSAFALAGGVIPTTTNASSDVSLSRVASEPRAAVGGVISEPILTASGSELLSLHRAYAAEKIPVLEKADGKAKKVATIQLGEKVQVTEEVEGDYQLVDLGKTEGWVLASKLTEETSELVSGVVEKPCKRKPASFENKLLPSAIRAYRSVCALFPEINGFGGWRAGGRQFHKNGRAVDFMITPTKESELGWRVARYLVKNADEFNIDHVIFEQKMWTPSTQKWVTMSDRGSINENHFNHVHVAVRAKG